MSPKSRFELLLEYSFPWLSFAMPHWPRYVVFCFVHLPLMRLYLASDLAL